MPKRRPKAYLSEIAASVHEMMEGFHETGAIDKQTMRKFDDSCLTPTPALSPAQVEAIRARRPCRT
jgi:putative transcriptional regulator